METITAPVLYSESRLHVEPTFSNTTFHIPTESNSIFASRKRPRLDDGPAIDEDEFLQRYVAKESSIFFRPANRNPRSILWRVLGNSKILEIQSVDLTQSQQSSQESLLTFRLSFGNAIRSNGISFADSSVHDALEVFVLTTSNELFTFSLRRDLLLRATPPSTADFDPNAVFTTQTLSSFTFRHPYKLVALDDLTLLVALHDGSLLRLSRNAGERGAVWHETYFHDGGWTKSLRGFISWKGQNTIRVDNVDLDSNTAAEIEASPDGQHVFTVSLDHTLKSWNSKSGKVGFQIDLLAEVRVEGRQTIRYLLHPAEGKFLRMVDVEDKPDGDLYYAVVWSSQAREFKFWGVRDADSQEYGLRDVQQGLQLKPPLDELMGTNVWQIADFDLRPGPAWRDSQIWIRARSGSVVRIFTLIFDLVASGEDLEYAWKHEWAEVSEGSLSATGLSRLSDLDALLNDSGDGPFGLSRDEAWLTFLLYPGRFSTNALETALKIYHRTGVSFKPGVKALQDRIKDGVTARYPSKDEELDAVEYEAGVRLAWRQFYLLVKHLHALEGDSLSISLDKASGLCWSIRTNQVAPIRQLAEVEVLEENEDLFNSQDSDDWVLNYLPLANSISGEISLSAARLRSAARSFRQHLPASVAHALSKQASVLALRDGDDTHKARRGVSSPLQELDQHCGLCEEVEDEEFNRLTESVQDLGGLGELENNVFEAILEKLSEPARGQEREHVLSRYGDKATIRVAQDTLISGRETLLDLLALTVFVSQDLETSELAPGFKPLELYQQIMAKLREYDVLLWMASHVRMERSKNLRDSGGLRTSQNRSTQPVMTILESIFIGDWRSMSFPETPLSGLLTYWARAWTFGADLSVNYDGVTAHVMSNLIKHEDFRLAYRFSRFLPTNSWTSYLLARVYLGEGDYAYAASAFRRSADELSIVYNKRVKPIETVDTANLIPPNQRDAFNAGLPRFYLHVSYIYETHKLPSYAADFAELALEALEVSNESTLDSSLMDIDDRRRNLQDSPAAMQVDLAMEEIRLLKSSELKEEILSRIFTNAIQTSRYETAFSALVKFTNPAIKRSSLSILVSALLPHSPSTLLSLPIPPHLHPEIDTILHSLARKSLSAAAPSALGTQHVRLLYAYRIARDDFRAAAEGLWEYLSWLRDTVDADAFDTAQRASTTLTHLLPSPTTVSQAAGPHYDADDNDDQDEETSPLEREVNDTFLLLINALACLGDDEGWILAEAPPPPPPPSVPEKEANHEEMDRSGGGGARRTSRGGKGTITKRRRIVTLDEVRNAYAAELDRRSDVRAGRFPVFELGGSLQQRHQGGGGEAMQIG